MSNFTMAPQSVQEERTSFFYEYARRYAEAKTIKTRKQLQRQAAQRGEEYSERYLPPVPTDVFPRKYLMHSLRCLRMAPTEQELEDAERDVFNPRDTIVTLDQFLEICDSVRCVDTDVDSQDVLANFRSAIIMPMSSSTPSASPLSSDIQSQSVGTSAHYNSNTNAPPPQANRGSSGRDLLLSRSQMSNTFDVPVVRNGAVSSGNTIQVHHATEARNDTTIDAKTNGDGSGSGSNGGVAMGGGESPSSLPRRYLTRNDMRGILSAMTDEEFEIAMQCVDPQNTNQIDVEQVSVLLSGGGEAAYAEEDDYDGKHDDNRSNSCEAENLNNYNNHNNNNAVNTHKINSSKSPSNDEREGRIRSSASDSNASDKASNCSSQGANINSPMPKATNKNNNQSSSKHRYAPTGKENEKESAVLEGKSSTSLPVHASQLNQGTKAGAQNGGNCCGECVIQ